MNLRSALRFGVIIKLVSIAVARSKDSTPKAANHFTIPLYHPEVTEDSAIKFTPEEIRVAVEDAKKMKRLRIGRKKKLQNKKLLSDKLSAHYTLGLLSPEAAEQSEDARFAQDVTDTLKTLLFRKWLVTGINKLPEVVKKPEVPDCKTHRHSRHRTIDGTCNNVDRGIWGTPMTALRRLLPAQYASDGNTPRPVPPSENSRQISSKLFGQGRDVKSSRLNQMAMQLGQFINHDIVSTPAATYYDPKTKKPKQIKCCVAEEDQFYEDCYPIRIPKYDWFYDKKNHVTCLEFVRSATAFNQRDGVFTYGERQQMNQATSFIDGSQIYGSNKKIQQELADFKTGMMKTSSIHGADEYPPQDPKEYCESKRSNHCFKTGDNRANLQLNLIILHTVFVREHNRIATFFQKNTNWSGRQIYQETRRVVGAFLQHITYSEYLPAVLSPHVRQLYGLDIANRRTKYRRDVDPSIYNEFNTAAFRFGHSQVYHMIRKGRDDGDLAGKILLRDNYFNPDPLYKEKESFKHFSEGLFFEKSLRVDPEFSSSVSRELLMEKGKKYGLDLGSINIQRGRDHGLPTYHQYRRLLKGRDDFLDVMTDYNVTQLLEGYQSVENIDLYVGGLFENKMHDSPLGETFNHIIAAQFRNLMLGDRYFYTHKNTGHAHFRTAEFEEVQKVTMASIMCQNAGLPGYTKLQLHSCLQSCPNYMLACSDFPKVDLSIFIKRHPRQKKQHLEWKYDVA